MLIPLATHRSSNAKPQGMGTRRRLRLPINIPDVLEQIYQDGRELVAIVRWGREMLNSLSLSAADRLTLAEAEYVLEALDERLGEIRILTKNPSSPQLLRALALLDIPLSLSSDSQLAEVQLAQVHELLHALFEQAQQSTHLEQIAS